MIISLKPNSKFYLNGAVVQVDRKVNVQLMNDAVFLLDIHVLQEADARTPLRQLYFVLQAALMDPKTAPVVHGLLASMLPALNNSFENGEVLAGLKTATAQITAERYFDAMKTIRGLFPIEDVILHPKPIEPMERVETVSAA
ncbi:MULTISPECIES: flagellar biosynthesis repressor FlbT [unclassified Beijerinckia]|uniref:flagellar biosynthesis repressor FlbT n=1 Tax=unclassified Beijerinckia TaxID=2638183 RepID=UPI00089440A8|nr:MULTISPECIES: flagellar biosynthesis repressor FlbT [unclassified Beijerinckia]MDH7798663.1 flagellar protein FlbT [Beijerinckia sp. GAS462]SED28516.1 flagellar protein FlbT [Beijerinckia sp. 28-YEA-48]